jgi:hypothetical protein
VRVLAHTCPGRSRETNLFGVRHVRNVRLAKAFVCLEIDARNAQIVTMTTMSASLHLQADLTPVKEILEPILWPDMSAILWPRDNWISIYAEQLGDDLDDILELAEPLSELGTVFVVRFEALRYDVLEYQNAELIPATKALPFEASGDFESLKEHLPPGAIRVERDAAKPGLGEFFGRSADE